MRYYFFLCMLCIVSFKMATGQANYMDTVVVAPNEQTDEEYNDYDEYDDDEDEGKSIKQNGLTEPIVRYFPADSIQSLRNQKDFLYMSKIDSVLRNYTIDEPVELPSTSIFDEGVVRFILWTIALLAVVYLLFQVLAGKQNLFTRNKKLKVEKEEAEVPNGNTLSHIQQAQQAAAVGDYRKAVRFQFLYILQLLAEQKQVILLPQKTNEQYLAELSDVEQREQFSKLVLQYEYIWYGHFALNNQQYQNIEDGFRNFTTKWL